MKKVERRDKPGLLTYGLPIGTRVQACDYIGCLSNKIGTIVSARDVTVDEHNIPTNVQGAYKPVDWTRYEAIELDEGTIITLLADYLYILRKQTPKGDETHHE